jgi:hypothetical protein
MTIPTAINQLIQGQFDQMRNSFEDSLTEKAIDALESKKVEIAKSYVAQENIGEAAFGGEKYKGKDNPNRRKTGDEYLGRGGTHWAKAKARGWLPGKKNARKASQHAKASDASMELAYAKGAIPKELMDKARADSKAKQSFKEENLEEFTISDVQLAMKKKGKVDNEAIKKLKKSQHMGNVTRNHLKSVGHGNLNIK